jgi:hypothetical protein
MNALTLNESIDFTVNVIFDKLVTTQNVINQDAKVTIN